MTPLQRAAGNQALLQLFTASPATPAWRALSAVRLTDREGMLQRQPRPGERAEPAEAEWQPYLDAILPRQVGLLADLIRVTTLLDALGNAELTRISRIIYQDPAARALVRYYGVPGIIALHDTLVGQDPHVPPATIDVPAARFLLIQFPSRLRPTTAGQPASPFVFPAETAREAYLRFHSNAELEGHIRRNCIDIVRDIVPMLFAADPSLARRIARALGRLHGDTLTMPDAGRVLADLGVARGPTNIPFDNGNGNREPTTLSRSAWNEIMTQLGDTHGWHIFGLALFDGYHSVTVFVDNRLDGRTLYWADQWSLTGEPEHVFQEESGSISGFRRYERDGFDGFIEDRTRRWWNEVHSATSKCGLAHPRSWDRSCRYTATLRIWHLRSVPERRP